MPCALSAADRNSASTPGPLPLIAKYAKKPGWFQWVMPGTTSVSKSERISENASPCSGASVGSAARMSPGLTLERTG